MKKSFLLVLIALTSSTSAFAEKNIFTDCGIGALLFKDTQWAAVTSNIIWDLGTTATTSQVSSPDQCNGTTASLAKYIHQNYALIEENTAKGEGKHITSMLDILNCGESSRRAIIDSTRPAFGEMIGTEEYGQKNHLEKSKSYYNMLLNTINSKHAKSCQTS